MDEAAYRFMSKKPHHVGTFQLHAACRERSVEKARAILAEAGRSAELHELNREGVGPLHIAASLDHLEMVRHLVESSAVVNVKTSLQEVTPLDYACENGSMEMVKYLVGYRGDVNNTDKAGWTPVHRACLSGNLDIVKLLVARGGDLEAADGLGYTPLHRACMASEPPLELVRWLMESIPGGKRKYIEEKTAPLSLLHLLAGRGHLDTIKYLIEYGADVYEETDMGQTVLHKACECGSLPTVEFLVGLGLGVDAADFKRRTPLYVACVQNYEHIVRYLIKAGACVNVADTAGLTPLHVTCEYGFETTVRCLAENGADVNAEAGNGNTPLHVSAREGLAHIVDYLINRGARRDARNDRGSTPLHQACGCANVQAARCLLKHGSDPNLVSSCGRRPFQLIRDDHVLVGIGVDLALNGVDLVKLARDTESRASITPLYLVCAWAGLAALGDERPGIEATLEAITHIENVDHKLEILFASRPTDMVIRSSDSAVALDWISGHVIELPALKALSRAVIRHRLGSCFSILPKAKRLVRQGYLPPALADYVFLKDQAIAVFADRGTVIDDFFKALGN